MRRLFSLPLVTLPPVIDGRVVHSFVSTEDDCNPACPHTSATNNARKPESQRKIKEATCTEETSGPMMRTLDTLQVQGAGLEQRSEQNNHVSAPRTGWLLS